MKRNGFDHILKCIFLTHVRFYTNQVRSLYGKVFAWGFRWGLREKILSHTDRANEVYKTFIIWLFVHFLLFIALCSSSDVAVYLTSELLGFMLTLVRHSFASLIDKQLSKKATLRLRSHETGRIRDRTKFVQYRLFTRNRINSNTKSVHTEPDKL